MTGIYKITNPKSKIYIGQSIDINKRFKQYQSLCNSKSQTKLYRSLNKYGVENHIFEVIEECDLDLLNEKERYYQEFYDCVNKGLNCRLTKSNNKSGKLSEETKLKISKKHIKLRKLGIGNPPPILNGENNGMFNKKHSNESIIKMKNNRIKKLGENHHNSSIFLHLETGIFYFSVREISEMLNKKYNYIADRIYGKVKNNDLNIIKI